MALHVVVGPAVGILEGLPKGEEHEMGHSLCEGPCVESKALCQLAGLATCHQKVSIQGGMYAAKYSLCIIEVSA